MSPTSGAAISTLLSISFGEMSIWMNFFGALAPGLALAVRQQPVEARADQHHDVGVRQHVERAAPADCGCVSGSRPLAMDIGRYGMPVFSTSARISSSACA